MFCGECCAKINFSTANSIFHIILRSLTYLTLSLPSLFRSTQLQNDSSEINPFKVICLKYKNTLGSRYRNKFRYRDPLFAIPFRNILLIGTYSLSEQFVPIRSTLNFFVTYPLSEQSWVPILSTASLTPYQNKTVLLNGTNGSNKEYGQPYSLSEQNHPPYGNKLLR